VARETDDKKTRIKALNRLRRAKRAADAAGEDPDRALSDWESESVEGVEERLEKFGSAFADPEKGGADEALSFRQAVKLKEIEKKAKGKARKPMKRGSGFKAKSPGFKSRSRDIHEDVQEEDEQAPPRPTGPPKLRVITGGDEE
jgi:hypothetical protein